MGLTKQSQCGPATRCSPEGQRVSDSRDWDDSPSVLDGDPWPGLSGELSPGSEEAPVMPGEPPPTCALSPASAVREKGQRPVSSTIPRAPAKAPFRPLGTLGTDLRPQEVQLPISLPAVSSPSPPPSRDPPERLPEEEPPAAQARQVH
ncbi:hypothetical protein J1605_005946 [Eschrichtius robustus]|uniref:Uncharacterized protein n=1 Tax=Eschrichtius robustus TaxID=9764 RepID=A0AB34H8K7_ESCRO|nr:hypothetical protein J1605_005946 [Eschrichtius robustus]